jgi:hypothetical protein
LSAAYNFSEFGLFMAVILPQRKMSYKEEKREKQKLKTKT